MQTHLCQKKKKKQMVYQLSLALISPSLIPKLCAAKLYPAVVMNNSTVFEAQRSHDS